MTVVRKANRIIRVTDNELPRYLANGYVRVDVERKAPRTPDAEPELESKETESQIFEPAFKEEATPKPRTRRNKK